MRFEKPPEDCNMLVFIQPEADELGDLACGLLNEAGRLAAALDVDWHTAYFGQRGNRALRGLGSYGVPGVVRIQPDRDVRDYPMARADALVQTARSTGARLVLFAHDDQGSLLSPAVAAGLGGELVYGAVCLEGDEDGLSIGRRAFNGRVVESSAWNGAVPLVITVDPRVLGKAPLPTTRRTDPSETILNTLTPVAAERVQVMERIPPDPKTVDVTEAEVIFCAGKGLDPESFTLLKELCGLLNASLGVTRPVYDLGWSGFERMIGQTGKTVAPRFYLGLGISGSMHHVGGIRDSKCVAGINIDPRAPLFVNSDEGFVADVREVLPLLLDRIRAGAAGGAA